MEWLHSIPARMEWPFHSIQNGIAMRVTNVIAEDMKISHGAHKLTLTTISLLVLFSFYYCKNQHVDFIRKQNKCEQELAH